MALDKFEFVFEPCFDTDFNTTMPFGRITLKEQGRAVQQLDFPIKRGSTFHSFMLVPLMEKVWQMYMGTNAALNA